MLEKINKLVTENYQANVYRKQLDAEKICRFCREIIEELFDKKTASFFIEVVSFKDGNLKIKFNSSVIACELQHQSIMIIEKINRRLDNEAVKKIIFVS